MEDQATEAGSKVESLILSDEYSWIMWHPPQKPGVINAQLGTSESNNIDSGKDNESNTGDTQDSVTEQKGHEYLDRTLRSPHTTKEGTNRYVRDPSAATSEATSTGTKRVG